MKLKRRHFLIAGAGTTAALVLGWGVLPNARAKGRLGDAHKLKVNAGELALNGWLKIDNAGRICLLTPRSEMGQGIHTALAMLVAEELNLPVDAIAVQATALGSAQDDIYSNVAMFEGGSPFTEKELASGSFATRATLYSLAKTARNLGLVVTGGSSSTADAWEVLRLAGAACRETLKAAAAVRLGVQPSAVTLTATAASAAGKSVSYAELAREGSSLAHFVPAEITLKASKDFTLIGKPTTRVDLAAKGDGSATFGIDARPARLLFAAVKMCPTLGGKVKKLSGLEGSAKDGVLAIETLAARAGSTEGVAVVARTSWHAKQALDKIGIEWDAGANAT